MSGLSWPNIIRLGLVQSALGAMVLLTTSTMNRIMHHELGFAATLPGVLVGLHHAVEMSRPGWGYGSDVSRRRTPWIIGGMAVLGIGVFTAALATAWMGTAPVSGVVFAFAAYFVIGLGASAAGTTLLAMLAAKVKPARRAPAATTTFLMMIVGFIVTKAIAGPQLDPYTPARLVWVTGAVVGIAFVVSVIAAWGVERSVPEIIEEDSEDKPPFMDVLKEVWADPQARAFTVFVFISMMAYGMQDIILEPFAGVVFGMTPGESTTLSGQQDQGLFFGMVLVGYAAGGKRPRLGSVRLWTIIGCLSAGAVLATLAYAAYIPTWPIRQTVMALGFACGMFAAGAISWMMVLAGDGPKAREGIRMGLWGGSQAIGMALGGFLGTVGVDVVRFFFESKVLSFAAVFWAEAALFVLSGVLAFRMKPAIAPRAVVDEAPVEDSTPVLGTVG